MASGLLQPDVEPVFGSCSVKLSIQGHKEVLMQVKEASHSKHKINLTKRQQKQQEWPKTEGRKAYKQVAPKGSCSKRIGKAS